MATEVEEFHEALQMSMVGRIALRPISGITAPGHILERTAFYDLIVRGRRGHFRLSGMKRPLRWVCIQYSKRPEEAARAHDRMIERICKTKAPKHK